MDLAGNFVMEPVAQLAGTGERAPSISVKLLRKSLRYKGFKLQTTKMYDSPFAMNALLACGKSYQAFIAPASETLITKFPGLQMVLRKKTMTGRGNLYKCRQLDEGLDIRGVKELISSAGSE